MEKTNYTPTCNLLTTTFSLRADAQTKEPNTLQRWRDQALYAACQEANKGKEAFVLHDGPPYANGDLHMGHALNKVLKDMVCKYHRMSGKHCPFVPGWDCHGLPIELKVTKQHQLENDKAKIDRKELRRLCREYAASWIEAQRRDFMRLGVIADWGDPDPSPSSSRGRYSTMSYDYEASIVKVFASFVEGGYVHRHRRTVPWCASCQTVLAKAEIEYKRKDDPSCYVLFPLTAGSKAKLFAADLAEEEEDPEVHLVAWTTTPWTLPLNRALAVNPSGTYALLRVADATKEKERLVVVGAATGADLCKRLGLELVRVVKEFPASHFQEADAQVNHPFVENLVVPVVLDDMVALKERKAEEEEKEADESAGDMDDEGDQSSGGKGKTNKANSKKSNNKKKQQQQQRNKGKNAKQQRKARPQETKEKEKAEAPTTANDDVAEQPPQEQKRPAKAAKQDVEHNTKALGTQIVHAAPGCGPEDYDMAMRKGLEVYSPVDVDGRYTADVAPGALAGKQVSSAGQLWVLEELSRADRLLAPALPLHHSYPHCWRCKQPLIFRATDQWFCSLERNDLVARSRQEIEQNISFLPASGRVRLAAFTGNRAEWCISRQRHWGVPIPALHCRRCRCATLDAALVRQVAEGVARHGVDYWEDVDVSALGVSVACRQCGNSDPTQFEKERDILDVWFDSGVSHYAVLKARGMKFPCDMYLEGSDQHRGWFQSSLLCSLVACGVAPMRTILTHGFLVNEKGEKMSKSSSNGIAPQEVISKYSADVLRLWTSSVDYSADVPLWENLLESVANDYRKVRTTCRFLIANVSDFGPEADAVDPRLLLAIDKYALSTLADLYLEARKHYENCNFLGVYQALTLYCRTTISAWWVDAAKLRLYFDKPNSFYRRSAQTVCYHMLDTLCRLMAPILSFLAEEVSDHYQGSKKPCSIHLQSFVTPPDPLRDDDPQALSCWQTLKTARNVVMKAIEEKRKDKVVHSNLDAQVTLVGDPEGSRECAMIAGLLEAEKRDAAARNAQQPPDLLGEYRYEPLRDFFVLSECRFLEKKEGSAPEGAGGFVSYAECSWLQVKVEHADGAKCPRCWRFGRSEHPTSLCARCHAAVEAKRERQPQQE